MVHKMFHDREDSVGEGTSEFPNRETSAETSSGMTMVTHSECYCS